MGMANLALRFFVEIIGIGALAYWGVQTGANAIAGIIQAVGSAVTFIVVWAIVVAPKATNPLSQPQRDAIGTGLLLVAAGALAVAGQPNAAVIFGAIVVLNWALLRLFGPDARISLRSAAGR